eukprot:GHVS01064616.1.p2 GENE.GHVS01064616.1~~GHVS01064616.1.p2  ORF type:complete len:111 (-),score=16.80 GHVS01064616.1:709-1041(-)
MRDVPTTTRRLLWTVLLMMLVFGVCRGEQGEATSLDNRQTLGGLRRQRNLGVTTPAKQRVYLTSLLGLFPIKTVLTHPYPYGPTSIWQLKTPCCPVPYNTTGRWNGTAWT